MRRSLLAVTALVLGVGGCAATTPAPVRSEAPASASAPGLSETEVPQPQAPVTLADGVTTAPGTAIVGAVTNTGSPAVGWHATLALQPGTAADSVAGYFGAQLRQLGFTVTGDGTRSVVGTQKAPDGKVTTVRVDVVAAGADRSPGSARGYARILLTHSPT